MMADIRAFVGHSFAEDDADVVRKFLTYFERISGIKSDFSWAHAENAEPKELAEKVMSLLDDKNLFIGICTKKERAIPQESLKQSIFRASVLMAQEKEFAWKTSDWIIQEIGIAKGKNLSLILLVEKGVRKPGGIQGDVEYIEFDRDSPQESFVKILEMITALSPSVSIAAASSISKSISVEKETERKTDETDGWLNPQPGWDQGQYRIAYIHMNFTDDVAGMEAIENAYLQTLDAAQTGDRVTWDAFKEFWQIRSGTGGHLDNLMRLATENPDNCETQNFLAQGYEFYEDYANSASAYEAALSKANTTDSLYLMGCAAVAYQKAKLPEKASAIINQIKLQVEESGNGELEFLKVLQNVAELMKENDTAIAIAERIVELNPSDVDTRFSLAYKHSECGNDELSLYHYVKIPHRERVAMSWNNLGAAFDKFALPAKSVNAYRKAAQMDETLAMSNLAYKLMRAGFFSEAEEECNKALAIKDYHKNIGAALAKLKDLPDEEDKKEAALLEKAKPKSDFYRQFGRALSRSNPSGLGSSWEGPDCSLEVTLDGDKFRAIGSYERQSGLGIGSLAAVLAGSHSGTTGEGETTRYRVEYNGILYGRGIEARVTRDRVDATPKVRSLLDSIPDPTKTFIILANDGSELKVMESPAGGSPRFYTLKRQAISV